jgi:hypothetical protein
VLSYETFHSRFLELECRKEGSDKEEVLKYEIDRLASLYNNSRGVKNQLKNILKEMK